MTLDFILLIFTENTERFVGVGGLDGESLHSLPLIVTLGVDVVRGAFRQTGSQSWWSTPLMASVTTFFIPMEA